MKNTVVSQLFEVFIKRKITLSLAESCTGGALSATLTAIPNCSQFFLGSVIAYTNQVKIDLLGVHADLILKEGAVSQSVVLQMAEGICRLTSSDYSLAVSGVAGPSGGTCEKPVGTVWIAIHCKNKGTHAWCLHLKGNRQEIINETIKDSLEKLLNQL